MKIINVEQGTEQWHIARWGKIGGSRANDIFTESETLLMNVTADRLEDYQDEDSFESAAMIRGKELEPQAIKELEAYTAIQFNSFGWLQCEQNELLGISPDGLSDDLKNACEVKRPSAKTHLKYILDGVIPKEYIGQCIHYFTVNPDLETLHFASFRPENKIKPLFVAKITRDSLVDIGRTIKGKVKEDRGLGVKEYVCQNPDIRTVDEWSKVARNIADLLLENSNKLIESLKF